MSQKNQLTKENPKYFIMREIQAELRENLIYVKKQNEITEKIDKRFNHSNGKTAFLLVNSNDSSNFNANQIKLIKEYDGEYDTVTQYWIISI